MSSVLLYCGVELSTHILVGGRICPGRHFSSSLLYALISSTLAIYDIDPPLDGRGEPVLVTPEMTSGLLS